MQQAVTCPNCGSENVGQQFCTNCGTRLPTVVQQQVVEAQPAPEVPTAVSHTAAFRKYASLRAIATIQKIVGWVILVGGSLFSIALGVLSITVAQSMQMEAPSPWGFVPLEGILGAAIIIFVGVVVSVLLGLFCLAFAELCYVAMDMEENTRSQK